MKFKKESTTTRDSWIKDIKQQIQQLYSPNSILEVGKKIFLNILNYFSHL